MLQLLNETRFAADRALLLDGRGSQLWVVAIKATYVVGAGGQVLPHEEQEPVTAAPRWSGEPGRSSLLREGELVVVHPGTDVTFNASAWAPGGRPATHVDVGVAVGPLRKVLRVHGPRIWYRNLAGLSRSPARPFDRMPITWERAFGGTEGAPDAPGFALDTRNPVGRGFATSSARLADQPLPNVEDVRHPIESPRDRPEPAGLGAVAADWSPRRELGGTYDERWRRTRMPLWPADFDPRFHVSAPAGLSSPTPLQGGERVATTGLRPEGAFTFQLPREYFVVETRLGGAWTRQRPQLERVIVEPDDRRLVMVWAARLDCGPRGREVEVSRIVSKEWASP